MNVLGRKENIMKAVGESPTVFYGPVAEVEYAGLILSALHRLQVQILFGPLNSE